MINRYSRKELKEIWEDHNKYSIWLEIELAAAEDKESHKARLVEEYNEKFSNPDIAAQLGLIDNIIKLL